MEICGLKRGAGKCPVCGEPFEYNLPTSDDICPRPRDERGVPEVPMTMDMWEQVRRAQRDYEVMRTAQITDHILQHMLKGEVVPKEEVKS